MVIVVVVIATVVVGVILVITIRDYYRHIDHYDPQQFMSKSASTSPTKPWIAVDLMTATC